MNAKLLFVFIALFLTTKSIAMERQDSIQSSRLKGEPISGNMALIMANQYRNGTYGFDKDEALARKYYTLAAKKWSEPDGQYNLALMYENGEGGEKDILQAIHWYQEAYKNGVQEAGFNLATFYIEGIYTNKNLELARNILITIPNVPEALGLLASMYYKGEGGEIDYKKSYELTRRAASIYTSKIEKVSTAKERMEYAKKMGVIYLNLGLYRYKGTGTEIDKIGAVSALKNASLYGNKEAENLLKQFTENAAE